MRIPFTNYSINKQERKSTMPLIHNKASGFGVTYTRPDIPAFYMLYERNSDLRACVRERMQSTAINGFRITDNEGEEIDGTLADYISGIVNPSRPLKSFRQIKNRITKDISICGNAYCYIVMNDQKTEVLGLQPIHPVTMSVITDKYGQIKGYMQRSGMQVMTFLPEEILHIKLDDDVNNESFGESP